MDVEIRKEQHPDFENLHWRYDIPALQAHGYCATKSDCKDAAGKFLKRLNFTGNWKDRRDFEIKRAEGK